MFYDLPKEKRAQVAAEIRNQLLHDFREGEKVNLLLHFDDPDTYIRKNAYLATGKLWEQEPALQPNILEQLQQLLEHESFRVRQTAINAAGEIGKYHFDRVAPIFDTGLFDPHHSPRNAVIGSIKKMGEVNPEPVLRWAKRYLHHPDKEIRREICHGIELRGRKHPADILPLLKALEFDPTARVRNTLVHVLGQIAYKKSCLATVADHLLTWENESVVKAALEEIIDVHHRYRNFAVLSQEEAIRYVRSKFPGLV